MSLSRVLMSLFEIGFILIIRNIDNLSLNTLKAEIVGKNQSKLGYGNRAITAE